MGLHHDEVLWATRAEAAWRRSAEICAEVRARRLLREDEYVRARYLRALSQRIVPLLVDRLGPISPLTVRAVGLVRTPPA